MLTDTHSRALEMARVFSERDQTPPESVWWPIPSWEVPAGIRFDVPRRNQGQIVEVAYGTFGRWEAASCDPFRRVTDTSGPGIVRFYMKQHLRNPHNRRKEA